MTNVTNIRERPAEFARQSRIGPIIAVVVIILLILLALWGIPLLFASGGTM